MSAIDRVREKFQIPLSGGSKGSKSHSAGSAASMHRHSEIHGHPSAGSAGALHRDSEKLSALPHVALARRRHAVAKQLEADPSLRYSFDVANASPTGPASGPVSVVLALRDSTGRICAGELHVPPERWPGITLFSEFWRLAAEARLS